MKKKTEKLKAMGFISHAESKDKLYGKRGTAKRELYEQALKIELIGEFLKRMRKNKNVTQEQLASQMGLKDKSYISKMENDANEIKISTLRKYLEALNASKISLKIVMENGKPEELVII